MALSLLVPSTLGLRDTQSSWRLRVSGVPPLEDVWALTEVRFFEHENCTGLLSTSNIDSSGVSASSPRLAQLVRADKAFDGSTFSYWKGEPDHCGDLWIAADLQVRAPGCVEIYQSFGVDVQQVSLEKYKEPQWLTVAQVAPLEACPSNVNNCCLGFDDVDDSASSCAATPGRGVTTFLANWSGRVAYPPAATCNFPSIPPPSPPPPMSPPGPGLPPAAPPSELWVETVVPSGLDVGDCYEELVGNVTIRVCVPAGAAAGDTIRTLAQQLLPPSPPPVPSPPPGAGEEYNLDDDPGSNIELGEDDDSCTSAKAGLGVALGLMTLVAVVLALALLREKRKHGNAHTKMAVATMTKAEMAGVDGAL